MSYAGQPCALCGRYRLLTTPGQPREKAMHLPRLVAFLGSRGEHAHPSCAIDEVREVLECVVIHGRLKSVNGVDV